MFIRSASTSMRTLKGFASLPRICQSKSLGIASQSKFCAGRVLDPIIPSASNIQQQHHRSQTASISSLNDTLTINGIEDYEKALQFFTKGKFRISHEFFRRTLDNLKKAGLTGSADHLLVLKKMVSNQVHLKRYKEAEDTLEEIIEILQNKSSSDALIYKEYNNLFLHCLKYNLNKAIILGKALLSEGEKKKLPAAYEKIFTFNLGTAYLLKSNFVDAKQRLRECIKTNPNPMLRGFALNNLAVACWWHKHPSFRDFEDIEEEDTNNATSGSLGSHPDKTAAEYSLQQIDADFENVIPLFKKALWHIENIDQDTKDLHGQNNLQILLDLERTIPVDHTKFVTEPNSISNTQDDRMIQDYCKVESGIPLINIQEFIFHTSPQKQIEAAFWFKYALKFYEAIDPNNIERCLITLGVFCNNYNDVKILSVSISLPAANGFSLMLAYQYLLKQEKAEGLFKQALEMIGSNDNYSKILCLQMYGKMLLKTQQRYKEGEEMIAEAHQIAESLPFWFNKINYVSIPKLDLS